MQMNRRDAIKTIGFTSAALMAAPWAVLGNGAAPASGMNQHYPFHLPDLPYGYDALDSFIDTDTMTIHHTRHHAGYVNNLNKALENEPDLHDRSLNDLLAGLNQLPESIRTAVRNHGGGHANHMLFWSVLQAEESAPSDDPLAGHIKRDFGDVETFLNEFRKACMSVFGSGWAWLSWTGDKLVIETTPNQDTPIMHGHTPLAGIDIWEHAYYLRYQNRRADYVDNILRHINWTTVNHSLSSTPES